MTLPASIDTFVFDLDDTLYRRSSRLHEAMIDRVVMFIQEIAGDETTARALHKTYYERYGASLVGLMKHHDVDPLDFIGFVHEVDLSPIGRGEGLADALERVPGRRLIFTNGSRRHAERVLAHLGIAHLFEAVCDIEACDFVGKPSPAAFQTLMRDHAVDPHRAVMFDDRLPNLLTAHQIGMHTVLIDEHGTSEPADHVHATAAEIAEFLSLVFGEPEPSR
ncbi:pyrimidine 5'-nucleotidase [Acuticoccus mangrovi]|uniref:Pyrimidine 5'-nucleotidase n=1 Tax=Acuticoccus mangrovi TaxID=2796142 RepID=A0A934IRM9_9HYPH|nr:pyrimidine 5'-nucleotidase [Acuticoccus mangrovi]MBJ3777395.1 pyrimidine 5'-nucleotidase [Acuticoccus mangrovi]